MKHVKDRSSVRSFDTTTSLCVRRYLGCFHIKFSYFLWHSSFGGMCCYFSSFAPVPYGQTNFVPDYVFLFFYLVDCLDRALVNSYQPIVFQLNLFFFSSYFIVFQLILLSLLLNYNQYFICFVIKSPAVYCTFHSPIFDGIVW